MGGWCLGRLWINKAPVIDLFNKDRELEIITVPILQITSNESNQPNNRATTITLYRAIGV